jgi:serine/threonine protein kinase
MAEVWKAKALGPHGYARKLVVKRVLPALLGDEECLRMFVEEARLSASLNHRNIVQVYEFGEVADEYYLAMEWLHGRDLNTILSTLKDSGDEPSLGLAAFVTREVCRALAYAHALTDEDGQPLRIIHRDVSPSNVMVGFDGSVKLLDFGIAKALASASENRTQAGVLKGKFGYMAPEQIDGDGSIDHRVDLFVVGINLWELLTLRRLFKGPNDVRTMALVREARVPAPSTLNPRVPPELDAICLRALARRRDDRFADCGQMEAALDEIVHAHKFGGDHTARMMRLLFPDVKEPTQQHAVMPAPASTTPTATKQPEAVPTVLVMEASLPTETASEPTVRGRRRRGHARVVAFAAATILAAAGVVIASGRHTGPAIPMVTVKVTTRPAGAEVIVDGESRGTTPLRLTLKRGTAKKSVTLTAPGCQPTREEITPDVDSRLHFDLERATYPSRAGSPAPRPALD